MIIIDHFNVKLYFIGALGVVLDYFTNPQIHIISDLVRVYRLCEYGLCVWIRDLVPLKGKERPNGDMIFANADKLIKSYVLIEFTSPSETYFQQYVNALKRIHTRTRTYTHARVNLFGVMFLRFLFSRWQKNGKSVETLLFYLLWF